MNLCAPGACKMVDAVHARHNGARRAALPVAGMENSRPGKGPTQTIFTNMGITKEHRVNAHQAIVPERLYNGDVAFRGGIVNGRRPQRKKVLHVQNIKLSAAQLVKDAVERL